jgi:hypothetical protein
MVSVVCRHVLSVLAVSALFACSSLSPKPPQSAVPKECDDGSGQPWVLLQYDVSPEGGVVAPKVLDSCPPGKFDNIAIEESLQKWLFPPSTLGQSGKRAKLRF